ncbi:MAG: HAD-IA family hydrolase [Rhodoblastus sp.]
MSARLLVFDLDGTLVDSQDRIVEAQRRTFAAHGLTPPDRRASLSVVGLSLHEAFAQLLDGVGAHELDGVGTHEKAAAMAQTYKDQFNALRSGALHEEPLFPGAFDAIARYGANEDLLLGVATGKSRRGVRHLFSRTGWGELFATVQTADDHPSKPAPDMIEAALAETGLARAAAFMIGDTTYDMAMARAAGVHAIGVAWGYHDPRELSAAGAETIIGDFAQLDELIARAPAIP